MVEVKCVGSKGLSHGLNYRFYGISGGKMKRIERQLF